MIFQVKSNGKIVKRHYIHLKCGHKQYWSTQTISQVTCLDCLRQLSKRSRYSKETYNLTKLFFQF